MPHSLIADDYSMRLKTLQVARAEECSVSKLAFIENLILGA
jgi:hypothetical protein